MGLTDRGHQIDGSLEFVEQNMDPAASEILFLF